MARGLPKSYIKKYGVSKRAWREYRKAKGKKVKSTKKQVKVKKRSYSMAKKKRRRSRKFTIPVAVVVPILSKFMSAAGHAKNGDWENARKDLLWHFALIDSQGKFNATALNTWAPVVLGMIIHWGASKFGLNRALGRAGVPLIRI